MEIEPEPDENLKSSRLASPPEHIIAACCELLSSGRTLSEVLAETQRIASTTHAEGGAESASIPDHPATGETAVARWVNPKRIGMVVIGVLLVLGTAAVGLGSTEPPLPAEVPLATAPVPPPLPVPISGRSSGEAVVERNPPQASQASMLPRPEARPLIARGDAHMASGDVQTARLFYGRAVTAGDDQAALRLGATYDPVFIEQAHLAVKPDPTLASYWYAWAEAPAQK